MITRLSRRLAAVVVLATVTGGLVGAGPAASVVPVPEALVQPGTIRFADSPKAIPDNYIVVLRDGTDPADTERLASTLSNKYGATLRFTYTSALQGFAVITSADKAALLAGEAGVDYVEQDQEFTTDTFVQPNPPSWGLDRIDEHSLPLDLKYHYPSLGNTVRAFIIDTGILLNHNEINGRAFCGFDPFAAGCAPCNQFHGTHVASTVGGVNVGVAKGVTIVSVRVFQCSSSTSTAIVIAGVNYVTFAASIAPGVRSVANMSLGGPPSAALDAAVTNSIATNVHYSVAAGNSNQNACNFSPARVPRATTVGATDINDNRAVFSNFGPCLDLFAPGVNIFSAVHTAVNAYGNASGTSMSAPHSTGVAALWRHKFPLDNADQTAAALVNNATPGVVVNPGVGSPNLLLFSNMIPV